MDPAYIKYYHATYEHLGDGEWHFFVYFVRIGDNAVLTNASDVFGEPDIVLVLATLADELNLDIGL